MSYPSPFSSSSEDEDYYYEERQRRASRPLRREESEPFVVRSSTMTPAPSGPIPSTSREFPPSPRTSPSRNVSALARRRQVAPPALYIPPRPKPNNSLTCMCKVGPGQCGCLQKRQTPIKKLPALAPSRKRYKPPQRAGRLQPRALDFDPYYSPPYDPINPFPPPRHMSPTQPVRAWSPPGPSRAYNYDPEAAGIFPDLSVFPPERPDRVVDLSDTSSDDSFSRAAERRPRGAAPWRTPSPVILGSPTLPATRKFPSYPPTPAKRYSPRRRQRDRKQAMQRQLARERAQFERAQMDDPAMYGAPVSPGSSSFEESPEIVNRGSPPARRLRIPPTLMQTPEIDERMRRLNLRERPDLQGVVPQRLFFCNNAGCGCQAGDCVCHPPTPTSPSTSPSL